MVDILMACHNGEKYIRTQILSILQQTYFHWNLYVYDDVSSDNTLSIVKEFSSKDGRIHLVNRKEKRLGAAKSFFRLLHYSKSKYVMFCDQDDVWFEKKIEILVNYAKSNFSEMVPSLVYCDAYGYSSEEGVIISSSVSRHHAQDVRGLLFMNSGYQGCSMLFNQKLASMVRDYRSDYYYMHDDVVTLLAHVFGEVHHLPKKLMLYRQHDKNVTGNIERMSISKLFRILFRGSFVVNKNHYKEKLSFYRAYGPELPESIQNIFKDYFSYPERGLLGRLEIVWKNKFRYGQSMFYLLLKTVFQKPLG